MTDERWNGFRLEVAAIKLGGPDRRRSSHVPLGCKIQGVVCCTTIPRGDAGCGSLPRGWD